MININTDNSNYKTSRVLYIIEAAIEYFISIAVGTIYLAKLATYIGIPDWLTGILTAFVSLGCSFQIFAIFLNKYKPVKSWVTILHIISQIMFAGLYFIPVFKISTLAKTIIFVLLLLLAQIIHNIINAPKINWFMSLVDDKKRGSFTANKEMISLIGGMGFSYLLGVIIDHFDKIDKTLSGFIVLGIILMILMVLHSLTLVFSAEKESRVDNKSIKDELSSLLKNKNIKKIVLVSVLWNIASYATLSFVGTYQNNELGFSTQFASLIIIIGSFARVLLSKPLGKYADKNSFAKMLCICFIIEILAFGINIFTIRSNGKILYTVFYILHCMGNAGINSSLINLMYDYVDENQRVGALAINQTFYGIAGFIITLVLSPILAFVQRKNNTIFGVHIYAQQLFSAFSFIITICLLVYMYKVVNKIKK